MGEGTVALEVEELSRHFGGLMAVDSVSFKLREGEILGVIGPNGAGKTTVFHLVTGFVPPSKGRVRCFGTDITGAQPHRIAALGLVRTFQITSLFPNLTVAENVSLGRHLRQRVGFWGPLLNTRRSRLAQRAEAERVDQLLAKVGLASYRDEFVRNLSHGHQNLIQITSALAAEPKILLLDEPAGGLNPEETKQVGLLVKRIRDELGLTVLLVEHNMRLIMGTCDRIVALNYGRKIAEGSPAEIASNEGVIEAYLGRAEVA